MPKLFPHKIIYSFFVERGKRGKNERKTREKFVSIFNNIYYNIFWSLSLNTFYQHLSTFVNGFVNGKKRVQVHRKSI